MKPHKSTMVCLQIVSADINGIIIKLSNLGISLYDVDVINELIARFFVSNTQYKIAIKYLERWGAEVHLQNVHNDLITSKFWRGRALLISGMLLICLFSIFLSRRILFVQIQGNERVPALKIQEVASDCGIKFWARSREIRSEEVKNKLLESIPALQWAGINTSGSVAVICVEEKMSAKSVEEVDNTVSSIVASHDGVIDSLTVTSGNSLCQVGQAVKEGQTLISGYTDCGIVIKAQQAKGEVFAKTIHNLQVISPLSWQIRSDAGKQEVRHSLKIGKKLINFDKGSGISPATCVKMYQERCLTLPGGFCLPVSWVTRTTVSYQMQEAKIALPQYDCEQATEEYLLSQMVAGQILRADVDYANSDDCVALSGQYLCSEMIGRTKTEQSVQGETNSD